MESPSSLAVRRSGVPLRLLILFAVTAAAVVVMFLVPPIPQDPAYHRFADDWAWLGIPNFQNVVSNLPFLVGGAPGLVRLRRRLADRAIGGGQRDGAWLFLFLGIALTAFGSAVVPLGIPPIHPWCGIGSP